MRFHLFASSFWDGWSYDCLAASEVDAIQLMKNMFKDIPSSAAITVVNLDTPVKSHPLLERMRDRFVEGRSFSFHENHCLMD